jgi:hypothetical protein
MRKTAENVVIPGHFVPLLHGREARPATLQTQMSAVVESWFPARAALGRDDSVGGGGYFQLKHPLGHRFVMPKFGVRAAPGSIANTSRAARDFGTVTNCEGQFETVPKSLQC